MAFNIELAARQAHQLFNQRLDGPCPLCAQEKLLEWDVCSGCSLEMGRQHAIDRGLLEDVVACAERSAQQQAKRMREWFLALGME